MKKVLLAACIACVAFVAAAAFSACVTEEEHVHDMTTHEAVAATCTEDGNTAYYECDGCGKYFSDEAGENEISLSDTVVPATGHDMTAVAAKNATCTEDGNSAYYICDNCDKYFSDEAGENEIELSATVVPATGHSMNANNAKEATCTEPGNTAYYYCDTCEKYFSDEAGKNEIQLADTVIPATGHGELVKHDEVPATCTANGTKEYYSCPNCDLIFDAEGNELSQAELVIPATGHVETEQQTVAPTATTAGAVNLVCSVCGEFVRELVYLPELTDANVENGTYDYSVTYRYMNGGTRGTYFYRVGVYTLANTSYDIPDFTVELNTNIRALSTCDLSSGTANGTFSATYLRSNQALDSAKYGVYLDNLTAGTYKLTISSGLDITATVIGTDGSSVDLITSSDMTEGRFSVADGVEYMLVFHSAPSSMRTNIQFTIEKAEEIVLSLTQPCELGTLEGGNAAAGETGKAVEVKIDESLPEGSYQLKITGSGNIGRYYNFVITVNGEKYYTNINMVGGVGAAVTVTLKGGDVITVANGNLIDMGGLIISMTEA